MKRDRWDSSSSEEEASEQISSKSQQQESQSQSASASVQSNTNEVNHLGSASFSSHKKESSVKLYNPLLNGCRSVYDSYERLDRLDEGTYGIVWKAKDLSTNNIVALKQIKFDSNLQKEGFPMAALREIGVLLALSHENIVTVQEMVTGDDFDKVFMVMELMETDLQKAMKKSGNSPFPQAELKSMLYQILSATQHIHEKWIIHRDLKTSNILVHHTGKICLCDFGLARKYQLPLKAMTQTVITLWYRPVELLFGQNVYGPEVDMWSIGCIFGELLKKEAMMQGQGEIDQMDKIFKMVGSPNDENWPDFTSLPNATILRWKNKGPPKIFSTFPVNSFSGGQSYLDPNGFALLQGLLTLDPKKRLTADEALSHAYFKEGVEMRMPKFL
jgi:cell division cycle 2-like protein